MTDLLGTLRGMDELRDDEQLDTVVTEGEPSPDYLEEELLLEEISIDGMCGVY